MIRAMRRVLPPPLVVRILAVAYAVVLGIELIVDRMADGPIDPDVGLIRSRLLWVACAAFGAYRVMAFHPFFRPAYFEWLRTTPWTSRLPLPLGPISLIWQDTLVLAVLMLMAVGSPGGGPVNLLIAFAIGYLAALAIALAVTEVYGYAYICLFGFGAIVRLVAHLEIGLAVAVVLYLLGLWMLHRSLATFPWGPRAVQRAEELSLLARAATKGTGDALRIKRLVGYPHQQLKRDYPDPLVPPRHAILISLLAAWWAYVLSWVDTVSNEPIARMLFYGYLPAFASGTRCLVYCGPWLPPINLVGRILTFRWIIPGYDKVLIVPLVTLVVGYGLVLLTRSFEIPIQVGAPVVTFAVLALAMGAGPTVASWRLTGSHRIITGMSAQEMIKL